MQKKHSVSRGIIAILPLGLVFSLLLLLAMPAKVGGDAGAPVEFKASLEGKQVIAHKLDISKYSELPKANPDINPRHSSEAKSLGKESGFFASNEKLTICSKDGVCESQFNLENLAGEINDFKVYFALGFSAPPGEATLWQSTFFGQETKKKKDGSVGEVDAYRWIPVDESHFSFQEGAKRAFLLRYNVTPCTNGTWNVSFYSPFGVTTAKGKYASVCPVEEPVKAAMAKKGGTRISETRERAISGNSGIDTFYGAPSDYWNGSEYAPINLSIVELPEDNPLYQSDYRTGVEKGVYRAYFKPDAGSSWPVLAEKGDKKLGMKPFAIAYKDPSWGGLSYMQLASSSIGIPNKNSVTYPTVFTGTDVRYDYESGRFKETITLTDEFRSLVSGLGLPPDTPIYFLFEVDIDGLTPTADGNALPNGEETLSKIDFVDSSGSRAYSFLPSLASDSSKALIDGRETPYPDIKEMPGGIFQGNGRTFYASSVPLSWLMRSVYPIEIDPTTQFTDTYCLIHLYRFQSSGSWPSEIQIKWDISNLAAGETIQNSTLCLYPTSFPTLLDYRANVSHITNQSWNAGWSLLSSEYNAMVYDNVTTAYNFTDRGPYMCINITNITKAAYEAGEKNLTIRINHPDYYPAVGTAFTNSLDIGIFMDSDYLRSFGTCGSQYPPYLEITHNLNLTPTVVEARISPSSPVTTDTLKLNVTCNDPDNPTLNLFYQWSRRNLFEGNWTCSSWSACSPSNSYCATCTNGWAGYAEDRYSASDPGSGWAVSQNSSNGTAAPDFHAHTDSTGQGSLWAYRAFPLPASSGLYNISWWWRGYHTSQASPVIAYIWAGNVTPCNSQSQTTNCGAGNTTNALSSTIDYVPASTWSAWNGTNASFTNQNIANSIVTIGFLLDDASNAQAFFYEFDNLTLSPYYPGDTTLSANVSKNPANLSSGNLSWYDTWGANLTCSDSTYTVRSYTETSLIPSICGNITTNTTLKNDVTSTDTCFTFGANSTVLDCNGHTVTYGTGQNNDRYGVNITRYNGTTVKNCVFIDGNSSTNNKHGVYIDTQAHNTNVINNTISTYGTGSSGVYVYYPSNNNNISSNRISTNGTNGHGLFILGGVSGAFIDSNNITTNGTTANGIYLYYGPESNSISNNNITTYGTGYGIEMRAMTSVPIQYSLVRANTITTNGANAYGIHLLNEVYYNNFTGNTITTAAASIYMDGSLYPVDNNLFANSTITNGSVTNVYSTNNAYRNTFLNMTMNLSQIGFGATGANNLTIQWYARVNVTGPSGLPVQNALVNISDVNGKQIMVNNLTGPDGLTNWTIVSERYMTATQNYSLNNHTVNATSSLFFNSTSFNITGSETLNITVYPFCGTILQNTTLVNNVSSSGTCFTIGAHNVTLDCNGRTISYGSAGGYGVDATGYNGTTVRNCVFSENSGASSTSAVYLLSASDANITNNTITSYGAGSTGIYAYYNNVNHVISSNNITMNGTTAYGILLDSNNQNMMITHNTVTTNGTSGYGISVSNDNSLANETISYNTITTNGATANGIDLGGFYNSYVYSNSITTTGTGTGILMSTSQDNFVYSNNITTSGANAYGIRLYMFTYSNTLYDNIITTAATSIYLQGFNVAFYVAANTFANSTITNGSAINVNSTNYAWNNVFLNMTFNQSQVAFGSTGTNNLTVQWYAVVNVTGPTGAPVQNALVNISDTAGKQTIVGNRTGPNGLMNVTIITEKYMTSTQNYSLNNYTVNVTNLMNLNTSSFNITGNRVLNLTLYSSCGTLTESTTLVSNVSSSGTCFTIGAHNVTLDCNGYAILYGTGPSDSSIGVLSQGYNGTVIKNCVITQGNSSTNSGIAIDISGLGSAKKDFIITNNTITTNGSSADGIDLISYIQNATVYGNRIITYGSSSSAVNLNANSNNISIHTNNISTNGSASPGIYLITVSNSYLHDNSITTNGSGSQGIFCDSTLSNNQIFLNTISTIGQNAHGMELYSGVSGHNVYSNSITTSGSGAAGIYLNRYVRDNNFVNNTITTAATSVYLNGTGIAVYNNLFANSTITNGSAINVNSTNDAYNNNFLNMTFNQSRIAFGSTGTNNLTVQWYLRAYVANTSPIQDAIVNISDVYGKQIIIENRTNPDGYTNWTIVSERYMTATQNYSLNNHTVNVSAPSFFKSKNDNVTSTKTLSFLQYECGTLTQSLYIGMNIYSNDTCFTFGADGITLDCGGYAIIGNNSPGTYGIYAPGRTGITIQNCNPIYYYAGIMFTGTNRSNITRSSPRSGNYGTCLSDSHNNTIYGGGLDFIHHNQVGIYLNSSSDNNITGDSASYPMYFLNNYDVILESSNSNKFLYLLFLNPQNYTIYFNASSSNVIENSSFAGSYISDITSNQTSLNNIIRGPPMSGYSGPWLFAWGSGTNNLTIQQFLKINATYYLGGPVSGALVNISDAYGKPIMIQNVTNSSGLTNWTIVTQMYMNSTENFTFNNHTINVSKGGVLNSTSLNITSTQTYDVTIFLSECGGISASTTLLSDLSSTGTCLSILADNVVLDCNGHRIKGADSANSYGIYAEGRTNIAIKNCIISDYYGAIYLNSTSSSLLSNNTLNSSVAGLSVESSTLNNFFNNTFIANTNGAELTNSSFQNTINSSYFASSSQYDIYNGLAYDNSVYNSTSLDRSKVHFTPCSCNLSIAWPVRINFTDSIGDPLGSGGNFQINNTNNVTQFTGSSSPNPTLYRSITEVTMNLSQNVSYNNYTFYVSWTGGAANFTSANITGITQVNLTVPTIDCKSVYKNTTLTRNVTAQTDSTCFTMAADNIFLDCNGYNITGTNSRDAYAVYLSGRSNITVKNCRINKFITSIKAISSQNLTFLNNTVIDSGYSTNINANAIGIHLANCSIVNITNHTDRNIVTSLPSGLDIETGGYSYGIYAETVDRLLISNYSGTNHSGTLLTNALLSGSDQESRHYTLSEAIGESIGALSGTPPEQSINRFGASLDGASASLEQGHRAYLQGSYHYVYHSFGIYLTYVSNSSIAKVSTKNMSNGYGIYVEHPCASNLSFQQIDVNNTNTGFWNNCPVNITGLSVDDYNGSGVYLESASNVNLTNFNITRGNGTTSAIYSTSSISENNTFQNGRIQNATYGLRFGASSSNLAQNISINSTDYGIYSLNSYSNRLFNITSDRAIYSVYFINSNSTNFTDSKFYNSSLTTNILTILPDSTANIFLNTTANYSNLSASGTWDFLVQWYARVNVTGITGSALQNSLVNISSVNGAPAMVENLTGSNGLTGFVVLNDTNYSSSVNSTFNNQTINVTRANYYANSTQFNITSSATLNVTLYTIPGTTCGTINADTLLGVDVNSTATCFDIAAHNIFLDCNGHTVTYDTGNLNGRYGVNNTGYDNVTIRNCRFLEGNVTTSSSYAISIQNGADNNTIQNNTISTYGSSSYGVYANNGVSHNIYSNTIATNGSSGIGIYLTKTNFTFAFSNNITTNGSLAYGIYAVTSVINNSFYSNNITTTGGGYGIYLRGSTASTAATNNSIYLNNITTNASGAYGIGFIRFVLNNSVYSNIITTTGSGASGLFLSWSSIDNTFINNTITTAAISIDLESAGITDVRNNLFANSTITNGSAINLYGLDGAIDNTFLNMTFNKSQVVLDAGATNNLTIQWYARVNVTNSAGSPLQNVITNISDVNGAQRMVENLTDASGLTNWVILTEMYMNGSQNTTFNNHTINATKPLYAINSTSINITSSSTINLTLYLIDALAPSVTIITPSANQNVNGSILINATVQDANLDALAVYYWLSNSTGNVTAWAQMSNTTSTSFNATFNTILLSDGYYNVTINATDLYLNTNASEYVTIKIDNTAPSVAFVSPTPANNTNLSQSWVYVNVTTNEAAISASIDWNGTFYPMTQGSSTNWYRNMTGLSNGAYSYQAYVNDTANNTGSTGTMSVTLDTILPTLTFAYPTPPDNSILSQNWVYVNITTSERLNTALLNWSGTFYSMTQLNDSVWYLNRTGLSDATYQYNVYANDTANNTGSLQLRNVTIDTSVPTVTFVYPTPANNINLSQNWAYINITTNEPVISTIVNWNGTFYPMNQLNSTVWYRNMTSLSEGTYDYYVQANDSANNTGASSTQNLTIDTIKPTLTLVSPTHNNESVNYAWSYVNMTSSEMLPNATLNWNGTDYPMSGSGTIWYLNRTSLGDGNYSFFVNASDFANNTNVTETRWVNIDTTGPIITLVPMTPGPGSTYSRDWVFINVTMNEAVDNASVNWNGTSYDLLNSSQTHWYLNITGLSNGTYLFNVSANDTLGNTGISETRNVTIDTSSPMLTFAFPTHNDEFISYNWSYVNLTADKSLDNATLNWNGTDYYMLNTSQTEWYLNMTNLADGNYSFQARGNDSLNNLGYSEVRWVAVDSVPPIPSFAYPTPNDGANVSINWVYVNVSSNERIISAAINWNGTFYQMNQLSSFIWFRNLTGLGDGTYSYQVYVNDSANNSGNIGPRQVRVDRTLPLVSFVPATPGNNSNQVSNSVFLNVSINEETSSCLAQNSSGFYQMSQLNSTVWYATMASLSYSTNHSFTVFCNDTANNTGSSGPIWVAVDSAPSVSGTQICANATCSALPAFKGSSLNCSATVTDDFNSSIDVYFRWFVNGTYAPAHDSVRYSAQKATSAYAASPIPSSSVNKSDTWKCEARPFDGLQFGSALNSSSGTINNSAPSLGAPSINNTSPINSSILSCGNGTYSDADGDPAGIGYWRWFRNGTALAGQASQSLGLLAIGAQATDQIICEHMSEDSGYDMKNSTRQNSTVVIVTSASAPVPNNVTLCMGTACLPLGVTIHLNDTLNCSANVTDLENGTILQVNFTFYRNNTAYLTDTLGNVPNASISYSSSFPVGALRKSDTWTCEVSAYDGEYFSNRINGSTKATVNNTAPRVTSPSINDTSPYTDSILLCNNGSYSDVDNDSEGARAWRWFLNGSALTGQTAQILDLSQTGAGNRGDVINCSQNSSDTGWDSKYSPENFSTGVTIINKPPYVSVSISPSPAGAGSDVTCIASGSDADGDSLNFTYIWWNGTAQVATAYTNSTSSVLAGANTSAGETWTCQVTPFDGWANGTGANASVLIQAISTGCPPNCPATPSLSLSISGHCANQSAIITVTSTSGPIIGASLRILHHVGVWQLIETASTDAFGTYPFTPADPGLYEVQASLIGYSPAAAQFSVDNCGACGSCSSSADCNDGDSCTIDSCSGSNCSAACVHTPITACVSGDGCCPKGCTELLDSDCATGCSPSCVGDVPGKACEEYSCVLGECRQVPKAACCGNNICEPSTGESSDSCPSDCLVTCGNGICDPRENKCNCPSDCGACSGPCAGTCTQYKCLTESCACVAIPNCCGNGVCEKPENFFTCSTDCPPEFLSLRIYSPTFGQGFARGDKIHLLVKVFAEFTPTPSAIVSASGFFGKTILYDDGLHGDGAPGDGIYGTDVEISGWVPYGPQIINFEAQLGNSNGKRSSVILLTNSIGLNLNIDAPSIELGDTLFVSGNVSQGFGSQSYDINLALSVSDFEVNKQSRRTGGDFDFAYRTSFLDSAGAWTALVFAFDNQNNSRTASRQITVEEPVPEKFLSVEYLSPSPSAYLKGQDITITVKVANSGVPITGAQVKFYGPKHKAFPLGEIGEGVYSATYRIALDDPNGVWEIQTRAYKMESGVLHGGAASSIVAITDVPINLIMKEPSSKSYSVGETMPIRVLAFYSAEKLADNTVLIARLKDRTISLKQAERGTYETYLEIDPALQGTNTLIIFARDPYGNYGLAQVPLQIEGYSPWYYLKLYWLPILLVVAVATAASSYYARIAIRRRKRSALLQKKQEVVEKQRRVQSDYFVERSMDRETFDQLSQKYEDELRKVEREIDSID